MGTAVVVIRKATPRDAAAILACLRTAFAPYQSRYTPEGYEDTVLTPATIKQRLKIMAVFVAVDSDGQIIGTIACAANHDEGHLRGMAVLPESLGQGVAKSLLEAAETELRARGCRRVTLDTTEPLERAMRFYEKHGYRRSGRVADFFGMPLHEYAKSL